MNYVLDTNIPISMVKNTKFSEYFKNTFFEDASNTFSICFVSLGEIESIAQQNHWRDGKRKQIDEILDKIEIILLDNQELVKTYGTIDAYSQGRLQDYPLPVGMTSRNMGKNDLWIAAVTLALKATLVTTDKDFSHLHPHFIQVDYIDINNFNS